MTNENQWRFHVVQFFTQFLLQTNEGFFFLGFNQKRRIKIVAIQPWLSQVGTIGIFPELS